MLPLSGEEIARAAQISSILEVSAWKPGNVRKDHNFHNCTYEDFLVSAVAIGPAFREAAHAPVGQTVLRSIEATRKLVGTNTNLGVVLLLAPLAKAAGRGHAGNLRTAAAKVIGALTVADARLVYQAIRLAGPSGLGRVERCDVSNEGIDVTLREAMILAQDWDGVAREYATGFETTFNVGYPALQKLWEHGCRLSESILQTFVTILSVLPDSHIARRNGIAAARQVSELASRILKQGGIFSKHGRRELQRLDGTVCDPQHRMNPGTTADLVAAALFVLLTEGGALSRFSDWMRRW